MASAASSAASPAAPADGAFGPAAGFPAQTPARSPVEPSVEPSVGSPVQVPAPAPVEPPVEPPLGAGWSVIHEGFRAISATLPGTFCWGIVTGIAMVKAGLSVGEALAMSLLLYAGTAQLAVLPLLATGAGLPLILLTGLLANLRFLIYSATAAPLLRRAPPALKLWIGYHIIDTGLAVYLDRLAQRGTPTRRLRLYLAVTLPVYLVWHVGSIIGILGAPWIGGGERLAFVGILAIAAICGTMLRSRMSFAIAALAAATSIALIALPLRLGLFVAVIVAMLATPLLSRWLDSPRREEAR